MLASLLNWKNDRFIETLKSNPSLISQTIHEDKHSLSLGISRLELFDLILIDFSLRQINIALILIDPNDTADIIFVDLLSDKQHLLVVLGLASSAVLSKSDHSLYVIIL